MADCPGVTTPPTCGEEPHSDPGGYAVMWGADHVKQSASECCDACAAHAADPKNKERPCNSWVFCHTLPYCWSLDTGNHHAYGECWLKHQTDTAHPLYGQRGKFTEVRGRRKIYNTKFIWGSSEALSVFAFSLCRTFPFRVVVTQRGGLTRV